MWKELLRDRYSCAHCGEPIRPEEARRYEHQLLYGEHYHCKECDPKGTWDCISHDKDDLLS